MSAQPMSTHRSGTARYSCTILILIAHTIHINDISSDMSRSLKRQRRQKTSFYKRTVTVSKRIVFVHFTGWVRPALQTMRYHTVISERDK
eukprot:4142708-Pyramimonas_sp.AAC.1